MNHLGPNDIREALRASGHHAIADALDDNSIEAALAASSEHASHPVARLLRAREGEGNLHVRATLANTNRALAAIRRQSRNSSLKEWSSLRLARACKSTKHHNATSCLAEIRAAGYLVDAGFSVESVKETSTPTPDLCVRSESNDETIIEVAAKKMDGEEATLLQEVMHGRALSERPLHFEGVTIVQHGVLPAGRPKGSEESQAEVVARKFSRLKADARQASRCVPSVLWIDLQDEDWWHIGAQDLEAVFLDPTGAFYSSGFWHAVYGTIGLPLFTGHCMHPRPWETVPGLKHDGMFGQNATWSGALFSLHSSTVFLEHPAPSLKLSNEFLSYLHRLPRFDWPRSLMSWPAGSRSVQDRISDAKLLLRSLAAVVHHQI